MKHGGKKVRPTTIAYIVLFALFACALATGIILQITSVYGAAKITILFITPAVLVAAVTVALIDTRLNPNLGAQDKTRITKGVFRAFGCGITTVMLMVIICIAILLGVWVLLLIGYGSSL